MLLYIAAATLPMLAALTSKVEPAGPLSELGTTFALTATALLFLQFLSSGRYESLSGQIGIDRTMGFHRIAAYGLLVFALLHPSRNADRRPAVGELVLSDFSTTGEHMASGLFIHADYGEEDNHHTPILSDLAEPDSH